MNASLVPYGYLFAAARFVILLGVLIFVHELGHFIAAKLCNVYVVRLALGFGRRLFGIKIGETDYCVKAIPLGGYVRMVGQEDIPRTEEEAMLADPELRNVPPERRYDTQSARVRLFISVSGAAFNLLFAFPMLWLMFVIGIPTPIWADHTYIGAVMEGSSAEQAGVEPGWRVLSIDGTPITKWEDLQLTIVTNEDKPLDFEFEDTSGQERRMTITPTRLEKSNRASLGVDPLTMVAVSKILPGMAAERTDLKPGDIVLGYGGQSPNNESMGRLIETISESAGTPVTFKVLRGDRVLDISVVPKEVPVIAGIEFERSTIAFINEEKADPVARALHAGDVVVAVDGKSVDGADVSTLLSTIAQSSTGKSVTLSVERSKGFFQEPETFDVAVPLTTRGMIGILFAGMSMQQFGAGEAFVKSFGAFGHSFDLVMKMLYYLVAGRVSVKEMAGPVGIAVLTEQSWKLGFAYYLNIVALISINLGIINLLPIPMLDGGNIFFVIVETIRRKPLDEKIEITLQKIGMALVLFIVLLATYNDILRVIRYFLGLGEFLE